MKLASLALALGSTIAAAGPIEDLSSPKYKEREIAMKHLKENLTEDTIQKLLEVMKSGPLEASRRAEILLGPYLAEKREKDAVESVAKLKKGMGKLPWISGPDYGGHLSKATGTNAAPDWEKYRNATELYLLMMARDGVPLEPIVEDLKQAELNWIEQFGKGYTPPLRPTWE